MEKNYWWEIYLLDQYSNIAYWLIATEVLWFYIIFYKMFVWSAKQEFKLKEDIYII